MTSVKTNGEVEFRFFRDEAEQVFLAADFTQWLEQAIPMQPEGNGWWVTRLNLEGGDYRFRYVADGEWFTDFASHGVEFKKKEWNSVLVVPEGASQRHERMAVAA